MSIHRPMLSGIEGESGALVSTGGIRDWLGTATQPPQPRDTAFYADRDNLTEVGWGIVYSENEDPRILEALRPLLEFRRDQSGALFREITYAGESVDQFFRYQRLAPGPADPQRLPYYLTLIGGPEQIPYELQTALGVQRAVGRIYFEDPSGYRRYALGVVESESKPSRKEARLSLFAVRNADDPLTAVSVDQLARPLAEALAEKSAWRVNSTIGADADKASLRKLLDPTSGPLVFTAGHAVYFPADHPRQRSEQGGLVTADWPGPKVWHRSIPPDFLWTAADLDPDTDYSGLVTFFFGCYTAGTPRHSEFRAQSASKPLLASEPFVSALASRLLSHSGGSALAVVGHLDQTFEGSFSWPGAGSRVETFASALVSLTRGGRLGGALEVFARRYLEVSGLILETSRRIPQNGTEGGQELAALWQAYFDARGFLIVGDPAIRLSAVTSKPAGGGAG